MKKLQSLLFYLLLFCLPLQTRWLIYAPGSSFVEWSSVFFYLTDGLLLLLLAVWLVDGLTDFRVSKLKLSLSDYSLGLFLILVGMSIWVAGDKTLALYHWLRLLELTGLFYFVKTNWQRINWLKSGLVIIASGLAQAFIAIGQAFTQHDLGLRWLGETVLGPYFNGVAVVPINLGSWLRAYGTLPHPNVLAVFLVGVMAIWGVVYFSDRARVSRHSETPWLLVVYAFLLFAFYSTFSRIIIGGAVIFSSLGLLVWWWFNKQHFGWHQLFSRSIIYYLLVTIAVSLIWLGIFHLPALARLNFSTDDQAITERLYYNSVGGGAVGLRPWLGLGAGNFVDWFRGVQPELPSWFYQPVHNLYLLIATEVGLPALIVFLFFLGSTVFSVLRRRRWFPAGLLLIFLVFGLFDHFFWTLPQGQLIFWLTLGWVGPVRDRARADAPKGP